MRLIMGLAFMVSISWQNVQGEARLPAGASRAGSEATKHAT